MSGTQKTALLVEDDAFTRSMLEIALERLGFNVTCAGTAGDAMRVFGRSRSRLAVIDLDLGLGPNGLDLAAALTRADPQVAVLILTVFRSASLIAPNARVPVRYGYLVKDDVTALGVLESAIQEAFQRVSRSGPSRVIEGGGRDVPTITPTQAEVLRLLAMGLSNEEIAKRRYTTVRSVEATIQRIYGRLGLEGRGARNPRVEAARMYRTSEVRVGR